MQDRNVARQWFALALIAAPHMLGAHTETAPRPNIVLFLSDDMGWGQPGFNGGTEVETPNMDRIADEGVKLTQFYVSPRCSPSRAALLTGRYPWKNGMMERPNRETFGMLTDERTLGDLLQEAGYATWIVGKWHLGHWQDVHLPLQRGFEHHYGHYASSVDSFTHFRGPTLDWHRNGRPVVESGYSTFLLADEAVRLIERHDGRRPFFLYLPFNAVHNPNDAPDEYVEPYEHLENSKQRGQLKAMDVAIGQVLTALEDKGVVDDTLVIFLNDNGGTQSAGWNLPYRQKKSSYYEGGVRVPAVMRWPGRIATGSESDEMLHAVDLFPTLASLAGADSDAGLPLDGTDAWTAIAEGAESPRTEIVYALDVIRVGDWKLIEENAAFADDREEHPAELYNIEDDPYEETDLAASMTAKVTELRARLAYHADFERDPEPSTEIPNQPVTVYGATESAAYGAVVEELLTKRTNGDLVTLGQVEAAGDTVKLIYDGPLNGNSVPAADAFTVVLNPGYRPAEVTSVIVNGSEVVLTLSERVPVGDTVGFTYEVPGSGEIQDADGLFVAGVTWMTAEAQDDGGTADPTDGDTDGPSGGPTGGGSGGGQPPGGERPADGDDEDGGPGGRPSPGNGSTNRNNGPPEAAITVDAECTAGLCRARTGEMVVFTDSSTGSVQLRRWEFGDSRQSRAGTVRHAWSAPGFYDVTLWASDGETESTASLTVLVEASDPAGSCVSDEWTRCLRESRYAVTVDWWVDGGEQRAATVVPAGTDDSGLFRFFGRDNWEVLIKVLDGCTLNGHVWVFGASTTDLGHVLRVTDTVTRTVKEYWNDPGIPAAAITDATAFPNGCHNEKLNYQN
ncbi:MAG: sulfatase-like hydrolase/transferase [Holophagales bacterium]|nr:sulfatase-like hydrolase/transferase [Holophagales bacterium]MYH25692.1 sulfatase-like hydrolase/transferase [Holophagales bacterium]